MTSSLLGSSFEYPLNTTSTVAMSDYVRVVTAAQTSSNVTVANVASSRWLTIHSGQVIQSFYTDTTSWVNGTALITPSATIPLATAGTQILTLTMTPLRADSNIRIRTRGAAFIAGITTQFTTTLCRSTSTNALSARTIDNVWPYSCLITGEFQEASSATTSRTYSVRIGAGSASTWYLNGDNGGAFFPGATRSVLIVEELCP